MLEPRIIELIEKKSPEFRKKLDQAVTSTVHYILGVRDGSIYRFEDDIEAARTECWKYEDSNSKE